MRGVPHADPRLESSGRLEAAALIRYHDILEVQ
jgi:hypothetical protein